MQFRTHVFLFEPSQCPETETKLLDQILMLKYFTQLTCTIFQVKTKGSESLLLSQLHIEH